LAARVRSPKWWRAAFCESTRCYEENGEGGGTSTLSTPSSISVFVFFFRFFATLFAFLSAFLVLFDALLFLPLLFAILFFLAIASSSAARQNASRLQPMRWRWRIFARPPFTVFTLCSSFAVHFGQGCPTFCGPKTKNLRRGATGTLVTCTESKNERDRLLPPAGPFHCFTRDLSPQEFTPW